MLRNTNLIWKNTAVWSAFFVWILNQHTDNSALIEAWLTRHQLRILFHKKSSAYDQTQTISKLQYCRPISISNSIAKSTIYTSIFCTDSPHMTNRTAKSKSNAPLVKYPQSFAPCSQKPSPQFKCHLQSKAPRSNAPCGQMECRR